MPDFPEAAILAAARILGNDCHGGPPDEDDMRLAKDVLEAACPVIEQEIRARIAASLRRAAEGRREYAAGLGEDGSEEKGLTDGGE